MKQTIFRVSLDIHDIYSQFTLPIKKGDTSGRLIITLMENGHPYEITDDCYAVFAATKPNKSTLHNECIIQKNTIIYDFTKETTSTAGKLDCEIILYGEYDQELVSPRFTIRVHDSVYSELEVETSNEFTSLSNLITYTNALVNSIEQKLENGEFIGEQGERGAKGEAAKFGTPDAYMTVLPMDANPTAQVTASLDKTKNTTTFTFLFGLPKGLKYTLTEEDKLKIVNSVMKDLPIYDGALGDGNEAEPDEPDIPDEPTIEEDRITIYFNGNGGTPASTTTTLLKGEKLQSLPNNISQTGYNFVGWVDSAGNTITDYTVFSEDTTLYAQWSKIEVGVWNITFMAEGYANRTLQTTDSGKMAALPDYPEKTGFTFEGWYTGLNGAGKKVTTSYTFSADTTVYAYFKQVKSYTITFVADGKTVDTITTDTSGYLTYFPTDPTKNGYVFAGWYDSTDYDDKVDKYYNFDANKIVYAYFVSANGPHTISFDVNGITYDRRATDTSGHLTDIPAPDPTAFGYTVNYAFIGWYTGFNGTGNYVDASYVFTSNATVYAYFEQAEKEEFLIIDSQIGNGAAIGGIGTVSSPEIVIPNDVVEIMSYAFEGVGLNSVTINDELLYIGDGAFKDTGLDFIRIPSSVMSIGADAFYGCGPVLEIQYEGSADDWRKLTNNHTDTSWRRDVPSVNVYCGDGTLYRYIAGSIAPLKPGES